MTRCALCENSDRDLQQSHIIPSFAFKWLKNTGGPMRHTGNPNRRIQDGPKVELLCLECESLFSSFEKPFSEKIFYNIGDTYNSDFNYGPWMLKFCASISWRNIVYSKMDARIIEAFSSEELSLIDCCASTLRRFLLNELQNPGVFEQHFHIFAPIIDHDVPKMPTNINTYLLRAIDMDLIIMRGQIISFVKIGPAAIIGCFSRSGSKNSDTKLHVNAGKITAKPGQLVADVITYSILRAQYIQETKKSLSETQRSKILQNLKDNREKYLRSGITKAMLHDYTLFGGIV